MPAMQNTRWSIVQMIKRNGTGTVEELVQALSLAPMTVRQHLAVLQGEGLVTFTEIRKGPGRPAHVYTLSPEAEDLFPQGYDKLAERLLREVSLLQSEEIARLSEREKVAFILRRMAERVAGEYADEVRGNTFAERGKAVAALLRQREGTLSEWIQTDEDFLIQDTNCPFQRIAREEPELCDWHVNLLTLMLQAEVEVEQCIVSGDSCCLYRIQPASESREQGEGLPAVRVPLTAYNEAASTPAATA